MKTINAYNVFKIPCTLWVFVAQTINTKVNKVSYEYREKQITVESVLILTNDRKTPNRSLHKHWDGMRGLYYRNVKRHPDQLVWVAPFLRVSSTLKSPSSTKVSEFRQIYSKSVDIYVHCTHTYVKLNMSLNGWLNHWHKLWSTSPLQPYTWTRSQTFRKTKTEYIPITSKVSFFDNGACNFSQLLYLANILGV